MRTYEIEVPEERDPERGVVGRCPVHDEREEFDPGRAGGAFCCSGCGYELEVSLHDTVDWRDWGEWC